MNKTVLIALAATLGVALLAGTGCRRELLDRDDRFFDRDGRIETRDASSSIDLEGARRLDAHVRMGVGELRLSSAETSGAIATDLEYSRRSWAPEIFYEVVGDTGEFEIRQPEVRGLRALWRDGGFDPETRYSWDLGLPAGIPTDLTLDFGVGDAEVYLGGLSIEELDIDTGVGDVTIDLSGEWKSDLDATIDAGVGNITLRVPRDVGVRVSGRNDGLGNYDADGMKIDGESFVNDAYDTSPVTLDIELRRGVGDVTVEIAD